MNLKTLRTAFVRALTPAQIKKTPAFKGRLSYPRRKPDQPVEIDSPSSEIKATRKGAVHWIGKPGTGGYARALRRA